MTISTTKLLTVAGAVLLTASLGWLGTQSLAVAAGDGPAAPAITTALPGGLSLPAAQQVAQVAQDAPKTPPATAAPPAAKQPATLPRALSQSRARIEAALETPTELEFIDTPLLDVLTFLADQHQIQIVLDAQALDEAGIQPDHPINQVLSNVALQSALNLILGKMNLDYVLRDEVMMVTTRDEADAMMETRVYWLDGLSVNAEGVAAILTETLQPDSWTNQGGPGSLKPISPLPKPPLTTPMSGASLGPMGVSPDVQMGGFGEMGGFQMQTSAVTGKREGVVISQSQRMHRRIAELLEQLQDPAAGGE